LTWQHFREILKSSGKIIKENRKFRKSQDGHAASHMQYWGNLIFEKLKNTKPSHSPLSSHFGILEKRRGSSTIGLQWIRKAS